MITGMRPNSTVAPLAPASPSPRVFCLIIGLVIGLTGCIEQAADFREASLADVNMAPTSVATGRIDLSPRGATVALASMEGLPPALSARCLVALGAEARARDVVLAEPATARYQARGYLSAYPVAEGTACAYVWDVFQGGQARVRRLSEAVLVKTIQNPENDPWGRIDDVVLTQLAIKAADSLAAFLSTTPEAKAAARGDRPSVAAGDSSLRPVAFAPSSLGKPLIWPLR